MSIGHIVLAVFLLLFAVTTFTTAIPIWVAGLLAGVAGVLLLVGK